MLNLIRNVDSVSSQTSDSYCQAFLQEHYFCTLICQYKLSTPPIDIDKQITNQLSDYFSSMGILFLSCIHHAQQIIILLSFQHIPYINDIINDAFTFLSNALHGHSNLFFSVGTLVSNYKKLPESYSIAKDGLKSLFFTGYGAVAYGPHQDTTSKKYEQLLNGQYQIIARAIHTENTDLLVSAYQELYTSSQKMQKALNPNQIRNIYFQVMTAIETECKKRGFYTVFPKTQYIWDVISQRETLFELHEYTNRTINAFIRQIADRHGTWGPFYQVQKYVEEHYSSPTLTVIEIARNLHFTPAYLGQVFKSKTGTTINSYINIYRIKKAQELLRSSDRKLYEISVDVGYSDPNYFTRQFKKLVGETPSKYREKHFI